MIHEKLILVFQVISNALTQGRKVYIFLKIKCKCNYISNEIQSFNLLKIFIPDHVLKFLLHIRFRLYSSPRINEPNLDLIYSIGIYLLGSHVSL